MTQIASYYATVGVGIDPGSLKNVQNYLNTIQKKMEGFQKKAFKTSSLSLKLNNFSVNQTALRRSLQASASSTRIRLDNVTVGNIKVNGVTMSRQISNALKSTAGGNRRAYNLGINIRDFQVDSRRLLGSLNRAIIASSTDPTMAIRLRNFYVSRKELVSAINKALNVQGASSRIRIGALLSQNSLTAMKNQIRQAINQLVVNPTINPRMSQMAVKQARQGGSGGRYNDRLNTRDPRRMNPWYNPMVMGGAGGALLRYGAFSLPFIAGAYGLNALNTFASEAASQRTSLNMVSSMSTTGMTGDDNREFLRGLAQNIGKTSMGMSPIYTQMLAASTGTDLEPQMQEMFSGIMQYASVMGLGEQSIKRAMTGF